ncbi:CapA family protein [Ramlibacter solisilvae]|uniref:Poly-gamma-glutamate biosynthesis protein n=1 Tax=Ramlibacter tataouinensis TaxID=94132 RepID=A0A127JPM7_9BURK|nr:CapA family protein [Ramlibacter tataouinensis]AMO21875.1 poly-gamma-glutamate biosynthesis protein [Ramlibacter tataouinensis]
MSHLALFLAGDVMTGRGIDQVMLQSSPPQLQEQWVRDARDYVGLAERANGPIPAPVAADYIWGDALAELRTARPDLRIINLETSVTRSDQAWPGKGIHYRMHPGNLDCITAAGIDACALANNHVLDWGRAGLQETLESLHGAGLRTAGAGPDRAAAWAPAAFELPTGGRLLLFSLATPSSGVPPEWAATATASGVAWLPDLSDRSLAQVSAAVARHRRSGDRVIVSIHWGGNWGLAIPAAHRRFAHRLIEEGVCDLVHGHSSHHPLAVEVHKGRLILYGCGDLINDYEGIGAHGELRSDWGCLYFPTLDARSGALLRLMIVPMELRRFRLVRAGPSAREWLERMFREQGSALGSSVEREAGGWALRWR